jgi:hypothetical protein
MNNTIRKVMTDKSDWGKACRGETAAKDGETIYVHSSVLKLYAA